MLLHRKHDFEVSPKKNISPTVVVQAIENDTVMKLKNRMIVSDYSRTVLQSIYLAKCRKVWELFLQTLAAFIFFWNVSKLISKNAICKCYKAPTAPLKNIMQ